jgi:hypothetical protein
MSALVVVNQTTDGWNVHISAADDVVVRTIGKRITVAITPDDDDTPTPLDVTLESPLTST